MLHRHMSDHMTRMRPPLHHHGHPNPAMKMKSCVIGRIFTIKKTFD